jgi:hypothetical protein
VCRTHSSFPSPTNCECVALAVSTSLLSTLPFQLLTLHLVASTNRECVALAVSTSCSLPRLVNHSPVQLLAVHLIPSTSRRFNFFPSTSSRQQIVSVSHSRFHLAFFLQLWHPLYDPTSLLMSMTTSTHPQMLHIFPPFPFLTVTLTTLRIQSSLIGPMSCDLSCPSLLSNLTFQTT